MTETVIETYADATQLATAAGGRLVGAITSAIARRGGAHIVLTGGGTGIALLRHVADHGLDIDWSNVHLYWGDERFVPHTHEESNFHMAYDTLLSKVPIPEENIHPIPTDCQPNEAANRYEEIRNTNPVDLLTSGVFAAHFVNVVSPNFLTEIVEGRHDFVYGPLRRELANKAAAGCAAGILNAPDPAFNPKKDKELKTRYGSADHVSGKKTNKLFLSNSSVD